MFSSFPDQGVGVGLRPAHFPLFQQEIPKTVAWVEVISENYFPWKGIGFGRSLQILQKIRRDLPVALHGVSLNLGSTDPLDQDYLKNLKQLVDIISPMIVSDHLAWTGVAGENLHDLLPLPYTREALRIFVENIDRVQNFLGRQILFENPSSYLQFQQSEMPECEFIAEILKNADCGLLLDVNNVYVSSVNHGFDPITYLEKIPRDRVGQIHLAGHSIMDGYLLDTHDAPVCPEVWDLYRKTLKHFGPVSSMIERDDNIPEWQDLERELLNLGRIRDAELKNSG